MFDIFYRCYPYKLFLGIDGQNAVESILETFNILETVRNDDKVSRRITVNRKAEEQNSLDVRIGYSDREVELNVRDRYKKRSGLINWEIVVLQLGILFSGSLRK